MHKFPKSHTNSHENSLQMLLILYVTILILHDFLKISPPPNLLRVGLDYGEEVRQPVKNLSPMQGYLRQRLVWRTRWQKIISRNALSRSST